ncbi:MAG: DUF1343 domain-containing protein [Brumimicrobium sp.]
MFSTHLLLKSILIFILASCQQNLPAQISSSETTEKNEKIIEKSLKVGAERIDDIIEIIGKHHIAIIANQTSKIGNTHLVDTFLANNVNIVKVFSPEHGFRGDADAGESVKSHTDSKTGLPVVSLYGDNKKPTNKQLEGIDFLIFDLQDVGARFYTYISTMYYAMEAAAENGIPFIVLDRPNPTGSFVDGPIRKSGFESFVGVNPIPVIHGMTVGELAQMINGEKWLKDELQCDLTVISCLNYDKNQPYSLPVSPSPNLRSDAAIQLYPSLCLFEGTVVSIGRGTETPFEVFGHPSFQNVDDFIFEFTPVSSFGAKNPKLINQKCYGKNLKDFYNGELASQLEIGWLIEAYKAYGSKKSFFDRPRFFDLLAGTDELRKQIIAGKSEQEIRDSWKKS